VERAQEIADEFYPQNKNILRTKPVRSFNPRECRAVRQDCELARMLGYNAAKQRCWWAVAARSGGTREKVATTNSMRGQKIPFPGGKGSRRQIEGRSTFQGCKKLTR